MESTEGNCQNQVRGQLFESYCPIPSGRMSLACLPLALLGSSQRRRKFYSQCSFAQASSCQNSQDSIHKAEHPPSLLAPASWPLLLSSQTPCDLHVSISTIWLKFSPFRDRKKKNLLAQQAVQVCSIKARRNQWFKNKKKSKAGHGGSCL